MNKVSFVYACVILLLIGCQSSREGNRSLDIEPVDFSQVRITDNFWSPRLDKHVTSTLPVCIDQIENKTGRMRNFENAALGTGEHSGIFYDDSDVYKALEGIAYSLINNPDPELEQRADEWINLFEGAQQEDGYINTFYTLTGLDKRWTNMDKHEMYCIGHMIEAAIAYYQATGKRRLLDVSIRAVDHMMDLFGPDKRHWVPGHQEIELALVKLYKVTGEEKYLDFAYWLLEERGHGHGSKGTEGEWNPVYYQDMVPARDLEEITGHAVRAMYQFCGMADVAVLKEDEGYVDALHRLWDDVVGTKMYITGGIGSSRQNEGFTEPYDLPNYEAYCETCASVGMVLWNARMHRLTGDAKYIDVVERSLYNGVLAGISLGGDRFFYVNPLASHGDHHRREWYGTACCPSQVSRFLPSVGNYIYSVSDDAVWVNLFVGCVTTISADDDSFTIKQETNYPWDGLVNLEIIDLDKPIEFELRMRVPGWCKEYNISINGVQLDKILLDRGFAVINRKWANGDQISLSMEMPVEVVEAHPNVKENQGKRAIQRGPLVYCAEEVDNPVFNTLSISQGMVFSTNYNPSLLGGVVEISGDCDDGHDIRLIPYYAWDNRDAGEMKVWIDGHGFDDANMSN